MSLGQAPGSGYGGGSVVFVWNGGAARLPLVTVDGFPSPPLLFPLSLALSLFLFSNLIYPDPLLTNFIFGNL